MLRPTARADFWEGFRLALPLLVAVAPFGLVFGAVAVNSGLTLLDAMLNSALVYAGASQMVQVELFQAQVPAWSVVLAMMAVNFRHVLYSAALTKIIRREGAVAKAVIFWLLVDPQFALTAKRAEAGKPFSFAWYLGLGIPVYLLWLVSTAVGATFGRLITDPHAMALDLFLPIYFLALVMSFRQRPGWGAVVLVSAVVSVAVYYAPLAGLTVLGPPWHVTLGGLAGILVAALRVPRDGAAVRVSDEALSEARG